MIWTQQQIAKWGERTFGVTLFAPLIAARANAEMAELLIETALRPEGSAVALEECADIVIALYRLASMCGGDLQAAVDRKMAINVNRIWRTNGNGVGWHV